VKKITHQLLGTVLVFLLIFVFFCLPIFYVYAVGRCHNMKKAQGIQLWTTDWMTQEAKNCFIFK